MPRLGREPGLRISARNDQVQGWITFYASLFALFRRIFVSQVRKIKRYKKFRYFSFFLLDGFSKNVGNSRIGRNLSGATMAYVYQPEAINFHSVDSSCSINANMLLFTLFSVKLEWIERWINFCVLLIVRTTFRRIFVSHERKIKRYQIVLYFRIF